MVAAGDAGERRRRRAGERRRALARPAPGATVGHLGAPEGRRADLFAAAEERLGPPPPDLAPDAAKEVLVRRYLGGFGPSTAAELADWAGLPVGDVVPVLERLPLRRFRAEDGHQLFDVRAAPLPDAGTAAPVRFLPTWDAVLLAHARRKAILAEEHRPLIFSTRNPHSSSTFLVDGTVAGTWRHEAGRVRLEPFAPCPGRSAASWRTRPSAWPASTDEGQRPPGPLAGAAAASSPRAAAVSVAIRRQAARANRTC